MKVLHAANYHRQTWGSDRAWDETIALSRRSGLEVALFARDSRALPEGLQGKAIAFFSGVYAPEAVADFRRRLRAFRPDVVHTHELFPLISPWILRVAAQEGVPIVHTCYDYRLTCPIATHFTANRVCRDCAGGGEWRAVTQNCRNNLAESAAFALRSATARAFKLFRPVGQFIVLTEHGRDWLVNEVGVAEDRITIQPCVVPMPSGPPAAPPTRDYIGFAGRFTFEKGAHLAIEAARRAGLPLRLAGNAEAHPDIRAGDDIACVLTPERADLEEFYRNARLIVVPSLFEETFSLVSAEAMSHGTPVLAARIGALPYTVRNGETGEIFPAGDVAALATAMQRLWNDPALCETYGAAGRRRVETQFSEAMHMQRLNRAYARAIALSQAL